jgi:endonuclease YncB( thermonuclease family)
MPDELGVDPNPYSDLWAWYGNWSDGSLPSYPSRRRYTPDLYGRILGEVFLDGHNGNLEMNKAAPAEIYRGKPASGQGTGP